MNRPIFLLGAHKSGTTLLRALFDDHRDLFAIPIEAHFFEHLGWWIDYAMRRAAPVSTSEDQFIRNVKAWIRHSNESDPRQSDSFAKGKFDIEVFDNSIELKLRDCPPLREGIKPYIDGYTQAIHASIMGNELDPSERIVEKSVENAEFALELSQTYPDAYFVHIIRNPYANFVSIRQYIMNWFKRYPLLEPIYRSLYSSYYNLSHNRRLIERYYILRYEDLVSEPEKEIKSLCRFVNVEYMENMLIPTYLGEPWVGNSSASIAFEEISTARVNAWRREINPLEIALVNRFLAHIVEEFGYEHWTSRRSPLLPVAKESLKHYIANRCTWQRG